MIEDVRCKLLTHVGSIELQAQLDNDPIILPSIILQEFEEHTQMICLDIYANYVCQKLVSYLSSRQLFRFIEIISCDFELIATSIPGSCVISSLMVVLINDDWCKTSLLKLFEVSICRLICDPQGSHLLQLAINLFEAKDVKFIHQTVKENFFLVATDRFGCCLIKKIIEKTDFIFQLVLDNLYELSNVNIENLMKNILIFRINLVIILFNIISNCKRQQNVMKLLTNCYRNLNNYQNKSMARTY